MTLPNFLIIGAVKAGTTSLYYYLKQHPDIYVSPTKETNFFAYDEGREGPFHGRRWWPVTTLADYRAQFQDVRRQRAIGEASTRYLPSPSAAEKIVRHIPDAKLIAILRDPAERAYSHYCMHIRHGDDSRTFAQAIDEEMSAREPSADPLADNIYLSTGLYYRQLAHYFGHFDRSQIAVYLYEDFRANPARVLSDIFRFLGVDDTFVPDISMRYNTNAVPRSKLLQFLLRPRGFTAEIRGWLPLWVGERWSAFSQHLLWRNRARPQPAMTPAMRKRLAAYYREDILQLQRLIQKDLSHWLDEAAD